MIDWPETRLRLQLWLHQSWPFRVIAAIRLVLNAWREPPPTREEYEQYHDAKMAAESGLFKREAANENSRQVPPLTPEQIAFHGGVTAHKDAFSLKAALEMYSDRPNSSEVLQALKEASIARAIADANAAAKADELRQLTPTPLGVSATTKKEQK